MWSDLLWFLGIIVAIFLIWVYFGGPERARQDNVRPVIYGPTVNSNSNSNTNQNLSTTPTSGEVQVTPF